MYIVSAAPNNEKPEIAQNPNPVFSNGTITFIPHKLASSVGTAIIIVTAVKNFMTLFVLLEIIEANALIVPVKISR
jgi:hypothetical protein